MSGDIHNPMLSEVGMRRHTQGTETSKYLQEYKSTEIALVVASERAEA